MQHENRELKLAEDFVHYTDCNLFLTGKAGTGKTTFLHNLQKKTPKRLVVTAPTGVAALNAGGVTLHSLFQLPFGPYIPGSSESVQDTQRMHRMSKQKRAIIKNLDLLIIDEISMVRSDLLDAVDASLRFHRRSSQPFGGVQLLMIGDLHQLPPVIKRDEWDLVSDYYETQYFFSSKALALTEMVCIELKNIYRQSDPVFIQVLNKVRDNCLDSSAIEILNQRYIHDFDINEDQGYITLTTHNRGADQLNQARLDNLPGKEYFFEARVEGDFPEFIFPVPEVLALKKGAQVMFTRNDPGPDKLFFNGRIGIVTDISEEEIRVTCPGDSHEIQVKKMTWENIKYEVNNANNEIERRLTGEFEQYPLKLAWAITIHKSQGLTFERAIIDAGAAFAHGQVYVALSRCKTLNGMVLSTPINASSLKTDYTVINFSQSIAQNPPSTERLNVARTAFQQKQIKGCFDFSRIARQISFLIKLLRENASVITMAGIEDLQGWRASTGEIFRVSGNFQHELDGLFAKNNLPEEDTHLLDRINKGSAWFQGRFQEDLIQPLEKLVVETDNRELSKRIDSVLDELVREVSVKIAGLKTCEQGFSSLAYMRSLSEEGLITRKKPEKTRPQYSHSDISHPELFEILKSWRTETAREQNIAPYQVMHQKTLIQVATRMPDKPAALRDISGIGAKTMDKYGRQILDIIRDYRKKL
ncbi:HRDC domain-containing protein, partial [Desulfonatronovibrio magnus]|uniref:HRDC domain-containing protein n=1 Tax=Desulfonatronovibrio magnus TaxID=698827 RepID=UPI0005EB7884